MDKTLVNAISFVILLSWGLLARISNISVASDPLSSKAAVRAEVSPLLANTEMTCKNVFFLDGFW